LTAALISFYFQGFDFITICEKIMASSYRVLFREIDSSKNKTAILYINSFEGTSEKNASGCKQACDAAVKLFATNEHIKQTIRRPVAGEPCFTSASIETHNVFVCVPDKLLKLYAPLVHIIVAQSLEYFSSRSLKYKTPILFCLDEFASFGRLEMLDALRKLRKRDIRIMVLTQALADIDIIYGADMRKAMLNNFAFKCVLGATDADTQEYFAKLIGHQIVKKSSITKGREISQTESESREWVIEPSDLGRLGKNLILLHPEGYVKLRKSYYWSKGLF